MTAPFVRSPYNYDRDAASDESGLKCPQKKPHPKAAECLAQQQFRDECDINTIVKKFGLGYQLPPDAHAPLYGDFTGVTDFRTMLHLVMDAEDSFMGLPADVRAKFENDPARFVDFCGVKENLPQLRQWGFAPPEKAPDPEPKPMKVEVVTPAKPA